MSSMALDLRPLHSLRNGLRAGSTDPAMRTMFKQWGRAYQAFAIHHFESFEGGKWRPLAKATIQQRRRQGFPGPQPILRRRGEVKNALREGAPGNLTQLLAHGIRSGFGGSAAHSPYPGQKSIKPMPIAAIAMIHNQGGSKVPKREILVLPDRQTATTQMLPAAATAMRALITR